MNNLRKIMQKLAQQHPLAGSASEGLASVGSGGERQLAEYRQRLEECSAPMLQYEWAWLVEHIAALELCLQQPEMLRAAGGPAHVELLLSESLRCQDLLKEIMTGCGVEPSRQNHAVSVGEHAWEIREESIKKLWGWR